MKRLLKNITGTAASVVKIILRSRSPRKSLPTDKTKSIVILGNGPSLRTTMDRHPEFLRSRQLMAVNYAANSSQFKDLRPHYYIMTDSTFFQEPDEKSPTSILWKTLAGVSWPMILFVPVGQKETAVRLTAHNPEITIRTLNLTPLEGANAIIHPLFDRGYGMPRPRNVLIAAIMAAISEGFGQIFLAGADHTWSRTLCVDSQNRICTALSHFYDSSLDEDKKPVAVEAYKGKHLHEILMSLVIAFRSYFQIREYADRRGVSIINITPESMIDAFPKWTPPEE